MIEPDDMPLVTIVACCHNHENFVVETLDSIRKQDYSNIECIIINNTPGPSTQIIKSWLAAYQLNYTYIENSTIRNATENLQLGLLHAKGKYFQFLSCDDVLMLNKISSQVKLMELPEHIGVGLIHGEMVNINEFGEVVGKSRVQNLPQKPISLFKKIFCYGFVIHTPTVLIRLSSVNKQTILDPAIPVEDFQMFLAISAIADTLYIKTIVTQYRILQNSLSKSGLTLSTRSRVISKYSNNKYYPLALKFDELRSLVNHIKHGQIRPKMSYLLTYLRYINTPVYYNLIKFSLLRPLDRFGS